MNILKCLYNRKFLLFKKGGITIKDKMINDLKNELDLNFGIDYIIEDIKDTNSYNVKCLNNKFNSFFVTLNGNEYRCCDSMVSFSLTVKDVTGFIIENDARWNKWADKQLSEQKEKFRNSKYDTSFIRFGDYR